jgi:hypothetical protein
MILKIDKAALLHAEYHRVGKNINCNDEVHNLFDPSPV